MVPTTITTMSACGKKDCTHSHSFPNPMPSSVERFIGLRTPPEEYSSNPCHEIPTNGPWPEHPSKITSLRVLVVGDERVGKKTFLEKLGFVDNKNTFTLENGGTVDVTVIVMTTRQVCTIGIAEPYDCVLGLFDLTRFESLTLLNNAIDRHISFKRLVICGLKYDETKKRRVQVSHIINRITKPYALTAVKYFDVSTLTGYNLQKPFTELLRGYLKDPKLQVDSKSEIMKITSGRIVDILGRTLGGNREIARLVVQ